MNEVMNCILKRRSIRRFKAEMPKKEDIDQIIEAGLYAPSGHGTQSTIILVITNKELRDKISKDNYKVVGRETDSDPFYGAPLILIVLADKSSPNRAYDGSLVMENMMLAATSLGLGSIWINRAREEFETEEYKQLLKDLGIEGEWEGVGHCAVGYIDGDVPEAAPRKPGRVYYVE
ncbi:MAG: nitroreductase [Erysipelotrichaceae bacterium]|nr:nitroreductase [Erysipelotrichaceae bacterium]